MGTSQRAGLPGGQTITFPGDQYYNQNRGAVLSPLFREAAFHTGLPDLSNPDFVGQELTKDVDNLQDEVVKIDGSLQTATFRYERYVEVGESVKNYHTPIITVPPRSMIKNVGFAIPEWTPSWQSDDLILGAQVPGQFALFRNVYPVSQEVGGEDFLHGEAILSGDDVDNLLLYTTIGNAGTLLAFHYRTPYFSEIETQIILWFSTFRQLEFKDPNWEFLIGEYQTAGTRVADIFVDFVRVP